jgi:hypothetical protein
MNCLLAKLTKNKLENCNLPFITKNKRALSKTRHLFILNFNKMDCLAKLNLDGTKTWGKSYKGRTFLLKKYNYHLRNLC